MGELNTPEMFDALRKAAAFGSAWASIWLGDFERRFAKKGDGGVTKRSRKWYVQAMACGHPEAERCLDRLAAQGMNLSRFHTESRDDAPHHQELSAVAVMAV